MRPIRLVMSLVAAVLLVGVSLLVVKAIRSQRLEQASRNLALAERVFDEMERELSAFLAREEERSYLEYRYFYVPEGAVTQNDLIRSPLADPSVEPFVIGHFQIEPDGRVSSPLVPDDPRLLAAGGWTIGDDVPASVAEVERAVERGWAALAAPEPATSQAPGTIVAVDGQLEQKKDGGKETSLSSELLEKLNRGGAQRSDRAAKVTKGRAADAYRFSKEGSAAVQRQVYEQHAAPQLDFAAANEVSVDVRQDPMVSRAIAGDRLLLYRTVTVADRTYRQGVVLDRGRLFDWAAARTLEGVLQPGWSYIEASRGDTGVELLRSSPDSGRGRSGAPAFRHRFAAPFDDLTGELYVTGLPGLAGTVYVYLLSALVLFVAPLGLFAVYRMVAAQTEFTERRANFVSAVSHELKTPLTAIRMYGEMLRDGVVPSDDKRQRYYGIITAESERLTRLVDNVLELGRLQRGARTVEVAPSDPRPVLEEAIQTLRPHAEEVGFELRLDAAPVGPVLLDRDAFKQIVFNLVDNALKYASAAATREIVIVLAPVEGGATLSVRDHGPGVDAAKLGSLFDPFYRGEDELTRRAKGAGIGLALVRGLAEEMGARASARNAAGGGLEVEVRLRAAPA